MATWPLEEGFLDVLGCNPRQKLPPSRKKAKPFSSCILTWNILKLYLALIFWREALSQTFFVERYDQLQKESVSHDHDLEIFNLVAVKTSAAERNVFFFSARMYCRYFLAGWCNWNWWPLLGELRRERPKKLTTKGMDFPRLKWRGSKKSDHLSKKTSSRMHHMVPLVQGKMIEPLVSNPEDNGQVTWARL